MKVEAKMNTKRFSIIIVDQDLNRNQIIMDKILEKFIDCHVILVKHIQEMKSVFVENDGLLLIISEDMLLEHSLDVELLVVDYSDVAIMLDPLSDASETYLNKGTLCCFEVTDSISQLMSLINHLLKVEAMKNQLLNAVKLNSQKNRYISDAYSKLYNVQDALYKANSMAIVGTIAAGLAHEINNPLSYISNNVTVLKSYLKSLSNANINQGERDYILSDSEDLFEEMNHGIARISEIMNSIRFLSKIDSMDLLTEIDVIKEIDNLLVMIFNDKQIVIEKHYYNSNMLLIKNRNVSIALMNIMQNALYALHDADKPGKKFRVELTEDDAFFSLKFEDNGNGMEDDAIKKAFDPFFTTKPEGQGKGLGLSMAYKIIVEECHGDINIVSLKNQFTQVLIRIPKKEY